MERALRIGRIWSWLPTYRAVAEQEHLSKAAAQLGVTPSAVSRTLALLEEDIGQPLFNRVGRGIRLNAAGTHLLAGVRSAMRLVDESLSALSDRQFVGPLQVAAVAPLVPTVLLPALAQLTDQHPRLVPTVRTAALVDPRGALLRGEVDAVLQLTPCRDDDLTCRVVGSQSARLALPADDPLSPRKRLRPSDITDRDFVALAHDPWWPAGYRRRIAWTVDDPGTAATLARDKRLLAVLPGPLSDGLSTVPLAGMRDGDVFAISRRQLQFPGRAEALIDAVQDVLAPR
ncbi:MAG: LysR family transcriptional regulator [Myxococcota bacterium]